MGFCPIQIQKLLKLILFYAAILTIYFKIILFSNLNMVIPSEYIQIISAGIYAIALFFTIVTFWRTLSNNIFSELRNLDRGLAKIPSGSQYNDARSQWYSRIFN